ncbi:helix-turn-helix domain-containing protein [Zhongshania aquimaris]|uniref:Helix-turn-helix transcriptional regulator n=1 Tax=Zhongshania aquimaris TaxID=2857107 RepID=A0ABS6VW65_9GAMM|nr:helix-turn-helix transcriptional regulator [Zhongshania aquimaris]MBW2941935.1 helix-turn-helix transcriptional regulator [Zhongshania aquimaris]
MNILSNTQAVAARSALSLSQAKVAKDIGLSRAYLSQFESGKMILEDRWLNALNDYYQDQGWSPEEASPTETSNTVDTIRMRDGFHISAELDDSQVEELLNSYYENRFQIEALGNALAPKSFLMGLSREKAQKSTFKLLCLTALQDSILRQLRGHDTVIECCHPMRYRDAETIGQYASSLIAEVLGTHESNEDEEKLSWFDAEVI